MEKKSVVIIFGIILVNIFNIVNGFCLESKEDAIFEVRLAQWISNVNELDPGNAKSKDRLEESLGNLRKFYQEYSNNKYSDDAEYICLKSIDASEKEWESFITKYPHGKVEEFTKQQLRKLKGNFSGFVYELSIPYDLLLTYVKGELAWLQDKNYEKAVKYLSEFVNDLDYTNVDLKEASLPAYLGLLFSYKQLNRKEDCEKVKDKMIVLFPERKEQIDKLKFLSTFINK